MIDIHCHIVPNIDDGAKSLDDALEMAKVAYDEGIRKIVNTSHYHPNFEYKKGKKGSPNKYKICTVNFESTNSSIKSSTSSSEKRSKNSSRYRRHNR